MQASRLRLRFCTHDQKVGTLRQRSQRLPEQRIMTIDHRRLGHVASVVASAFLDGIWFPFAMAARAEHDLGVDAPWMQAIAGASVTTYPESPADAPRALAALVQDQIEHAVRSHPDDELARWITRRSPASQQYLPSPAIVRIAMADRRWNVPVLDTVADLAGFLRLGIGELEWYADVRSLERNVVENLRHYNYSWRQKRSGGVRLLEAPKQNLKSMQRTVLRRILDHIPAHGAAHGFRRGRSIQTYAAPHAGRAVVLRFDLTSFFASVPAGRVFGIYRGAGYAEDVAHLLTGLATNATPPNVLAEPSPAPGSSDRVRLRSPHLPQGAPTSPALANLAAFALDRRLTALAASFEATYTRYADDLAFSGGAHLARKPAGLVAAVSDIVADEGFVLNPAKTKVRTQDQRQVLTGMVVNQHLNVHRREYDQLKAMLHEASVASPESANRNRHRNFRAHLEGRIGFVQATNPARARKLWTAFDRITW